MLLRKPLMWLIVGVLAAAGTSTGLLLSHGSKPSAKVLGEKVIGSGSSSTSGDSSAASNNGNGKGNGGNPSPGHSFTISGGVQGLFPGVTSKLFLTVTNPNNQAMTVTGLTATLQSVSGATGCNASASNLTVGSYSGGQFDVAKNSSVASSGFIPLSLPTSVANACQGATYNLTYSGTAVQK